MSNSKTWLPLVAASAVLGLAALIFVVLLQEEGENSNSSSTSLTQTSEERAAAPQLNAADVKRDEVRPTTRIITELGTEEDQAFRNKVRFFVTSPDGSERMASVKVELRELPLPFSFAALGGAGIGSGGVVQTGVTDSSGSFAFFDVAVRDGVRYEIRAYHPEFAPAVLELGTIPAQGETSEYELRLKEGFLLEGRVLTKSSENPVSEARIIVRRANNMAVLLGASSSEPGDNDIVVTTDGGGYFEVQNAPLGSVEIVVKAKGFAEIRATELLDIALIPDRKKELTYHLGIGGEVAGRVESPDGSPLPGAEVIARRTENNQTSVVTGKSGPDGKFRLEGLLEAEEYFLTGQRTGYISEGQNRAKAGDLEVVIQMTQTGRVVGRALRAANSRPLRQFTATIVSYREVPKEPQMPELSPDQKTDLASNAGEGVSQDDLGAAQGGSLGFGTVIENPEPQNVAANKPPPRNPYAIYGNSPVIYTELRMTQKVIESRDGSFELEGIVAPGTYVVRIEASGLAPSVSAPFQCEKGTTVNAGDILLDAGGTLEGLVTDSLGAPVSRAIVAINCAGADPMNNPINQILGPIGPQPLQRKTTTTDEQGRYRIDMLIPTPAANIIVTKDGFANGDPIETPVLAGIVTNVPAIILKTGGGVYGVVLQDGISPMSGMKVNLSSMDQAGQSSYFRRDKVTGHDGKFDFSGIPEGKYKIHAVSSTMEGVNPFGVILSIRQSEKEIEVTDGSKTEVSINVPTPGTPIPGVIPTYPQPPAFGQNQAEQEAAAAKMKAQQSEEEAGQLKKKLREQQRLDEGGDGATGSDGGG